MMRNAASNKRKIKLTEKTLSNKKISRSKNTALDAPNFGMYLTLYIMSSAEKLCIFNNLQDIITFHKNQVKSLKSLFKYFNYLKKIGPNTA